MTKRFDVEVSLALGADLTADPSTWSWTDVTAYAQVGDGDGAEIFRGRLDEQTQAGPSWCRVRLDNADGRFSRLNPAGAYYGQLAKNTPIRIRACATGGSLVTRFIGYVSEWPPRWTHGQKYQWVTVRADGLLRRLGQGPVRKSAMQRTTTAEATVKAYYPAEGYDRTPSALRSGLPDGPSSGQPSSDVEQVVWDADQTLPGSLPLPTIDARSGVVDSVGFTASGLAVAPDPGLGSAFWVRPRPSPTSSPLATNFSQSTSSLSLADDRWILRLTFQRRVTETTTTDIVQVDSLDEGVIDSTVSGNPTVADGWKFVYARYIQSGSDVTVTLFVNGTQITSGTLTGVTLVDVAKVSGTFGGATVFNTTGNLTSVGHFTALAGSSAAMDAAADLLYQAGLGHPGEAAADRIDRLCEEDGVSVAVSAGDSAAMGAQLPGTLVELLREAEAADHGVLYEALTGQLGYQPLSARYNLTAALALDHDEGHVVDISVADDDRLTLNDVTVDRRDGGSATATDEDSITASGRYDTKPTLNLHTESQLPDHASWLLHVGTSTADEYRYPYLELALHKSSSLVTSWLTCDINSRTTIDNLPANPDPNQVDQIIEGYLERINAVAWTVDLNLSPYGPYDIGTYQDTDASGDVPRYDTEWSTTVGSFVAGTDTTLVVSTPHGPVWTTDPPGGWPILVRCSGAALTVSGIANVTDTFGRTVSGGWGTATFGAAWTTGAGTAADFAVGSGVGTMTLNDTALHAQVIGSALLSDIDEYVTVTVPATATVATYEVHLLARWTGTSTFYSGRLSFGTDGNVSVAITEGGSPLVTVGNVFAYSPGTSIRARFRAVGTSLQFKAWLSTQSEPGWQVSTTDATLTAGRAGLVADRTSTNTNTGIVISFDDFEVANVQAMTVSTTVANGVEKTISSGSGVRVFRPATYGLGP